MKKLAFLLALSLLLSGCISPSPADPPRSTAPVLSSEATTAPSTAPTTVPATTPAETAPSTIPTEPVPTEPPVDSPKVYQYENVKAMWLSQFDLTDIYLNGGQQRAQADFTARMAQVLDNVCAQGFNTVFLQIRPNADSMYPSEYYPMSAYVVGSVGAAAAYDPVEITVRLAHERDLSIHAWINPMRGMKTTEIAQMDAKYPIRQWYEDPARNGKYLVTVNGRCYLNPAYEPVRALICDGAREALALYDFDGLHMDDYFYPVTDASFDADAYAAYRSAGGTLDLAGFRRDSLSKLVAELFALTGSSRPGRIFGISPAGNVDTVCNKQYADVYRWCSEPGYLDYICPQVYFGLEHGSHDFVKVCNQFQDMIRIDSVDLIVGMTFGKALSQEDTWAGSGKDEWKEHKDVLARCLLATLELEKCRGVSVFCYQYFFHPATGESVEGTAQERKNFLAVFAAADWTP